MSHNKIEFSISDLAIEFDITTRTIRHYEEIGLLSPKRRGQTRLYNTADHTKLKLILRGKRLGFSLEESRGIVEMYDPANNNHAQLETLIAAIHTKRTELKQKIDDIKILMADLEGAEEQCLQALKNPNLKAI
jgi:DNA-binding transcriptional MerR regulator